MDMAATKLFVQIFGYLIIRGLHMQFELNWGDGF